MRVGLDTFTISCLRLDPLQALAWTKEHGLDGCQFGGVRHLSPSLEEGRLREIRAEADRLGLYSHVSVSLCNPHQVQPDPAAHRAALEAEIAAAAACGWHELHSLLGGGDERYMQSVPWTEQLADSAKFLRSLAPTLRHHGSRVNLETHGDVTTFELIRLIENVGPDVVGICLDTANVLCHAEHPTEAARRAAPYVHLTHIKDAMTTFTPRGYRRQTLPPGRGVLDWRRILPLLAEFSPNLPLSIEDHKWLFDFHVFEPHWLRLHPDLTNEELARVLALTWDCQRKVTAGALPDPAVYDAVPYADEVEDRVHAGRDCLLGLVRELGLGDRPGDDSTRRNLSMKPAPCR